MDNDNGNGITESDLLRALEEAFASEENPEGALTTAELVERTRRHEVAVRAALRQLKAKDRLEVVYVTRLDLADRQMKVPAYRICESRV